MNELLKRILDALTARDTGVMLKILIAFAAVFVFIIAVDVSGVLTASESRRLSDIAVMGRILEDQTLTTHERILLESSRKSAIYRRSLSARVNDFVADVFQPNTNMGTRTTASMAQSDNIKQAQAALSTKETGIKIIAANTFPTRNNAVFFISINFWLILIYIVLFLSVAGIWAFGESNSPIWGMIASELLLFVICAPLSFLLYWLFSLIFTCPIFGYWWLTYIIAAIASGLIPTSLWVFVLKH